MRYTDLFLFFLVFSLHLRAAELEFAYRPDPNKPLAGKCLRLHSPSGGNEFVEAVPLANCRPTNAIKVWQLDGCYWVDAETRGSQFAESIHADNCRPNQTTSFWEQANSACYEVALSGPQDFKKRREREFCRPEKVKLISLTDAHGRGTCYEVDEETQGQKWKVALAAQKCATEESAYAWFASSAIDGQCKQVFADRPGIAITAKKEDCIARSVSRGLETINARAYCLERAIDHTGKEIVMDVGMQKCKSQETSMRWFANLGELGECYEVDSETLGSTFRRKELTEKCRPENTKFEWQSEKKRCLEVDALKGREGYAAAVNADKCSQGEVYQWSPDPSGLGGKCILIRQMGDQAQISSATAKFCRPPSVEYKWASLGELKGQCWEMHPDGPQLYSNKVSQDNCRPTQVSFHFVRTSTNGGDCYEVDPETKGLHYAAKVHISKCRPEQ